MPHSQILSVFPSRFRYFTKCSLDRGSSLSISRVVVDEGPSATGCEYTTTFSSGVLTLCSRIWKIRNWDFNENTNEMRKKEEIYQSRQRILRLCRKIKLHIKLYLLQFWKKRNARMLRKNAVSNNTSIFTSIIMSHRDVDRQILGT